MNSVLYGKVKYLQAINTIKLNAVGHDDIYIQFIHYSIRVTSPLITHIIIIFNTCTGHGVLPKS